jgi:hypothetical protein
MKIRALFVTVALSFTMLSPISADTKTAAKTPPAKTPATMTIVGRLQKAVEVACQLVKEDKTNKIYSFAKSKYKNGTHVKITAHAVDVSPCQQGTPIAIDNIVKTK